MNVPLSTSAWLRLSISSGVPVTQWMDAGLQSAATSSTQAAKPLCVVLMTFPSAVAHEALAADSVSGVG